MKVLAINGSPRRGWNTEKLLKKALEGAASSGAETGLIQLYAEPFKGCVSCFACKRKNSRNGGLCSFRDALTPILEQARQAGALIIGSPVYYDYPTAQARAFLERLLFPLDTYMVDNEGKRLRVLDTTLPSAMIYTMNCPDWYMEKVHYPTILGANEAALARLFGYCETLYSCDTYQFSDYGRYDCNMFDAEKKALQRETQFPKDLEAAFALGRRLAEMAQENAPPH
ncbi:MAG: flavodoxin family protein [Deltaproteobacteria bacterium]|nr:flavodoxin family protein [Deltaproteobacteria bacterium]MBQ6669515.1 flavodoxin family protein [Deltaproteobacteria bacterium]